MTPALQLEIFDLRHFSAGSLRPLLDAESLVWSERLHWDYRSSADLLLQYLDSRVLQDSSRWRMGASRDISSAYTKTIRP